MDQLYDYTLTLAYERENIQERDKALKKRTKINRSIPSAPLELKYKYDSDPLALFWQARRARLMPLFQFLAYYQVMEYYYPIFSSSAAVSKIRDHVKDPLFNAQQDSHIVKILSLVQSSSHSGFGSEKDQLRVTIGACFNNEELYEYFVKDEDIYNFYLDHIGKNISDIKITVRKQDSEFVRQVSERIYDIRNKVVHKKADESDSAILFPFSPGANKLK